MILQKKSFLNKSSYIYYEYYKTQKNDRKFSFASKIDLVWSYLQQIWGYFSRGKCKCKPKKGKKFSRSEENEVRRVILLVKMLLFIQ
jgi:hypothetical protein